MRDIKIKSDNIYVILRNKMKFSNVTIYTYVFTF